MSRQRVFSLPCWPCWPTFHPNLFHRWHPHILLVLRAFPHLLWCRGCPSGLDPPMPQRKLHLLHVITSLRKKKWRHSSFGRDMSWQWVPSHLGYLGFTSVIKTWGLEIFHAMVDQKSTLLTTICGRQNGSWTMHQYGQSIPKNTKVEICVAMIPPLKTKTKRLVAFQDSLRQQWVEGRSHCRASNSSSYRFDPYLVATVHRLPGPFPEKKIRTAPFRINRLMFVQRKSAAGSMFPISSLFLGGQITNQWTRVSDPGFTL